MGARSADALAWDSPRKGRRCFMEAVLIAQEESRARRSEILNFYNPSRRFTIRASKAAHAVGDFPSGTAVGIGQPGRSSREEDFPVRTGDAAMVNALSEPMRRRTWCWRTWRIRRRRSCSFRSMRQAHDGGGGACLAWPGAAMRCRRERGRSCGRMALNKFSDMLRGLETTEAEGPEFG